MDHLVSLEEQVSQSFLTMWHLMVVFFDISKVCDAACQYGILQTDGIKMVIYEFL